MDDDAIPSYTAVMILATEARLTALDFETTEARNGNQGEPWQLGLVSIEKSELILKSMFECTFEQAPEPKGSRDFLAEQKRFLTGTFQLSEQWPKIKAQLESMPLIAHNVGTERKILQQAMPLHKFGPWIDTLVLSRAAFPDLSSHKLEEICEELELTPDLRLIFPERKAHDALYDAVAAGLLFRFIIAQEGWRDLSLEQLSAVKAKKYYEKKRREF